jgi:ribonucleoside-diphosphate reductase alpha chain
MSKNKLSENAEIIAKSRYYDENENWESCTLRVSNEISQVENDRQKYRDIFHEMIFNRDFIPAGRIMRNSGRPKGSLLNCYNVPIGDSIEEIGKCIADSLKLWSEGGGVGINFSSLRPKGDIIKGKGGVSSGLVSFIEAIDYVSKTIESGGARRAAALGHVIVDHPEILDFIDAKMVHGKLSSFNISVAVTDEFLDCVEQDLDWEFKFNQKTYGKTKARNVWDKIVENMTHNAEPGLLNWSNFTVNNSYYFQEIVGTNPCLTGDTLIPVANRGHISFKQLAEEGIDVPIYCLNSITKKIEVQMMRNPRKTGDNQKILKIYLDNGGYFKCNETHKIIMKNGTNMMAKDLNIGDSIHHMTKNCISTDYDTALYNGYDHNPSMKLHDIHMVYVEDRVIKNCEICDSVLNLPKDRREISICPQCSEIYNENKDILYKNEPQSDSLNFKIIKIEECGYEDVYNGTVDKHHNFYSYINTDLNRFGNKRENYICNINCGETTLGAYECCDLGSIVLPNYITGTSSTNWKKMGDVIKNSVRFLDNVLDANKYSIQKIDINSHNSRRIGLGVMGLADYLFKKGVRYGSPKGIQEVERLFKFIRDSAYQASIELAVEKGAFPKFDSVKYSKAKFVRNLPVSLRLDIKEKGIRNCTLLAMAPTGTVSLIADVNSGIEPLFCKAYKRIDAVGERIYVHPLYEEMLLKEGTSKEYFVDTFDLKPEDHLETQSIIQKYVDGSVSKTINLPENTTPEDLSRLLLEYVRDLKGCTVYRDGCRPGQILNKMTEYEVFEYLKSKDKISHDQCLDDVKCHSGKCDL